MSSQQEPKKPRRAAVQTDALNTIFIEVDVEPDLTVRPIRPEIKKGPPNPPRRPYQDEPDGKNDKA